MTDMENKDLEQESVQEEAIEPVEDGFSQPPEEESPPEEPALQEPQEPQEAAAEEPAPPAEEPQPEPQWQDVASHSPTVEPPAPPPPPAWPGQESGYIPYPPQAPYMPQPGQMPPPAAPYGQGYYGGYPPYYGVPPQPQPVPPQQAQTGYYPVQPMAYAPYGVVPPQPEPPQKKKKPLGLKILLWIVSILAAGSLIGFGVYVAYEWNTSNREFLTPPGIEDIEPPSLPGEAQPPESKTEEAEEEPEDLPNVDVTPNTDGIQITPKPEGDTLEPEDLYNQVVKSTVGINASLTREGQTAQSRGTGIIATADGYIITNAHVVLNSKSSRITVTAYDGQEYDAVVVGLDRTTDLAVVKTNDYGFTPAAFGDADELAMGEWVMALGNPGGSKYANTLTRGIVSGLNREVGQYSLGGMTYIQTDAAINPGNSGGPLVNMYGQVVGINSSKIVTENYEGMGFAIPVTKAQPILNELLSGGYIKGRTRLGIMIREIGSESAMMYQIPAGLMITQINEDSSFTGTTAQVGDIITALDGEPVSSLRDVSNLLQGYAPGDQITVTLYRPGDSDGEDTEIEVTVPLLEDKGETQE